MNGGEVGDVGEWSLKDLELYLDTLQHPVVHRLDASGFTWESRDRRERDGAQGDEALEGAERDRDTQPEADSSLECRSEELLYWCVVFLLTHDVR